MFIQIIVFFVSSQTTIVLVMENQSAIQNMTSNEQERLLSNDAFLGISIAVMILSLIGNILVILVVMLNRNLRTDFNYLIVNMAVSDLCVPLIVIPVQIADVYYKYQWQVSGTVGIVLCKLLTFIINVCTPVSIFLLIAISINRFVASVYPVKQMTLTTNLNKILIFIAWLVPIALLSPCLYIYTVNDQKICDLHNFSQAQYRIYMIVISTITFIFPLLVITTLYSAIVFQLHKNSTVLGHMLNDKQMERRKRKNRHIFYLSIVIIAAFVILWGPIQVFLIMYFFNLADPLLLYYWIFILMAYATAVVNPLICFTFSNNYRRGMKNVVLCMLGKQRQTQTRTMTTHRTSTSNYDSNAL